ncbi:MAG: ROK family glucokinase [Clostridiales bacterium]|nr:ROK family glucokinase [Clostridiales bacterium]
MKPYAFGVDLGGTTVKLGLFQTDGTLVEKWEIPTRPENKGENLLPDIALTLLGKLVEKAIPVTEVEGVGMGVPGAVLRDSYVKPCVNLDQWGGFDVAEKLSALCHLPVKIVNDANAAALGEMGQGGGKGCKNVVFVTLGTGVGGGIIVDGKLLAGVHGAGGEIGHIKVKNHEDRFCGCGKCGCLEQYASATGLVNSAKLFLASNSAPTKLTDYPALTCKDICDCAKAGDECALQLVEEMDRLLGKALAAISCVCDPEIIVIGGGVARAGSIILDGVQKYFKKYAFPAAEDTAFALAQLGNDDGIYGGVQMILSGV